MGDTSFLSGKAAIAGIGATDFSKDSGRSELQLAAEAVRAALQDAGLEPSDVDGLAAIGPGVHDQPTRGEDPLPVEAGVGADEDVGVEVLQHLLQKGDG